MQTSRLLEAKSVRMKMKTQCTYFLGDAAKAGTRGRFIISNMFIIKEWSEPTV